MAFNKRPVPNYDDVKSEGEHEERTIDQGRQDLHDAAVKAVENQHGPFARRNPNFNDLVKDAERQISQAVEINKHR